MRKIQMMLLALIAFIGSATAQTAYNPFTQNIHFEPEPSAFGFECGTTPDVVFTMGLTTADNATQWQNNPLVITICVSGFTMEGPAASVVTGTYASNFDWEYDSFAPNCLVGVQNQPLIGTGPDPIFPDPASSGLMRVKLKVPDTAPIGTVLAVNVNLQVPGYMNQFNSQSDDNESTQTQTFCPLKISGHVYNDTTNDATTNDNAVNGPVIYNPKDTQLYAHLMSPAGVILAITPIGQNGYYEFTNVPGSANSTPINYSVVMSMNQGTVGGPAPAIELPSTWIHTGEDCCDRVGDDGVADGTILVPVTNFSRQNVDFGIWTPTPTGPLPTTYKDFYVTGFNCNAILSWTTTMEQNTSHVEIYRKDTKQGVFNKIGVVLAAGNSQTARNYSYVDKEVKSQDEMYEYQLRFVDIDQKWTLSEVRSLKLDCGQSEQQISVFPNPSKGSINLVYLSEEAGQILELDVVDMTGRKIMSKGIELQAGNNVLNLDLSSVAIGQYFLRYAVQEAGVKGAVKFLKD